MKPLLNTAADQSLMLLKRAKTACQYQVVETQRVSLWGSPKAVWEVLFRLQAVHPKLAERCRIPFLRARAWLGPRE